MSAWDSGDERELDRGGAVVEPDGSAVVEPDEAPEPAARKDRTRSSSSSTPRRKKTRAPRRDAPPARAPRVNATRATLERGVSNTVHSIAFAVSMLDTTDGAIIAEGEANLTAAVMQTADQNPRFKAWLEDALKGGAYLQLVAAVGAIAIPIAARHLPLPPALAFAAARRPRMDAAPDVVPPEWAAPPPSEPLFASSPVHEPGIVYADDQGAYTVDEAGNVTPFVVESPSGDDGA